MASISEGIVKKLTLQDGVEATDNGSIMDVSGLSSLALQITGTFSGTITFEVSLDGTNYIAIPGLDITGNKSSTATAAGIYQFNIAGIHYFRARISAYTSGSITVIARAMPFPLAPLGDAVELESLLTTNIDIALSALRDAICASGASAKTLNDLYGLLNGTLTTQLSGSIPEYAWFTGAEQPIPADQTKFAWGYEFDETTGEISAYGWSGAAWVKAVI